MSKSPVKLLQVSPCANLDQFIKTFVTTRRQQSQALNLFKSSSKTIQRSPRSNRSHKSSLSDWRELYEFGRPNTQSFMLNYNQINKKIDYGYGYDPEHESQRKKYQTYYVDRHTDKSRHRNRSVYDKKSKTSFHFYRIPHQSELQIVGKHTQKLKQQNNATFRLGKARTHSKMIVS